MAVTARDTWRLENNTIPVLTPLTCDFPGCPPCLFLVWGLSFEGCGQISAQGCVSRLVNHLKAGFYTAGKILSGLRLHLSRSLADRWGTTADFTTSFLHSSRFSAFRSMLFHSRPVHSLMLSSHRFLCLPLRLPP